MLGADTVEHGISLAAFLRPNFEAAKSLENYLEKKKLHSLADSVEAEEVSPALVENGITNTRPVIAGLSPLFHSKMGSFIQDVLKSCDR